jgi:hypothetical protein
MINSSIPGAVLDASIGGNFKPFGSPISMQLLSRCQILFLLTVVDFEFACIEFAVYCLTGIIARKYGFRPVLNHVNQSHIATTNRTVAHIG